MLSLDVLLGFVNLLGGLAIVMVQGLVFALVYLWVFTGGMGLNRNQTSMVKPRGNWFARKLGRYRDRQDEREVRLDDIIGLDEAKQDLGQILDFLKRPEQYRAIGAGIPTGALLVGPPGTGKTLLARAMANEAGIPFFSLSASDFSNMWLGVGAQRIKQIYRQARRYPKAIVFIDEVDALARARGAGFDNLGGDANTLNAFLSELDGFAVNSNVITLAATNIEDQVDQAVVRPGRLDRQVYIGPPDEQDRAKLFRFYLGKTRAEQIDLTGCAQLTVNFTPAEIRQVVNEAGFLAVRSGRELINAADLSAGIDKVAATLERRVGSFVIARSGDLHIRLADVIGCDEAKQEVQEYINFLRHPERYRQIGAKVPRGFLFIGPPGTGKTLLAKAIANESGVPFYALSGSDFTEVYVGLGAARIRQVYRQARKHKAAIVFIDEIDALAAQRGGPSNQEAQTLNQFLVELDGFGRSNVLTIGATNRLDILDRAVLRPGRLDRTVSVPLPDLDAREQLFTHYLHKVQAVAGIQCRQLARAAWNMSGAEIAAAVNEASFITLRDERTQVTQFDLNQGIERVLFGLSSRRKVNTKDRYLVAVHEAGHAIVEHYARPKRILHKLTIVPDLEGGGGYSWSVKDEAELSVDTREDILAEIQVLFGGRVAEEIFCGTVTTGAGADLAQAARLARRFVWQLGMSDTFLADYEQLATDPRGNFQSISERTKERLDNLVEATLLEAKQKAYTLVSTHGHEHERLCQALLERESLYGDDILKVLDGEPQARTRPEGPVGLSAYRPPEPGEEPEGG